MTRIALAAAILAISACYKAEEKPMADSAAAAPAAGMDTMKMADSMKMMDTTKAAADAKAKGKM